MNVTEVIRKLASLETRSTRLHYFGDATDYAFKRHVLIALYRKKITKRKPTEWNLFVAKYLKEGKTIQHAAVDWKNRGR